MLTDVSPNDESSSYSGKPEAIIDIDATTSIDSPIKRRKVLTKIDSRVLPALIVVYFLAFLDRCRPLQINPLQQDLPVLTISVELILAMH